MFTRLWYHLLPSPLIVGSVFPVSPSFSRSSTIWPLKVSRPSTIHANLHHFESRLFVDWHFEAYVWWSGVLCILYYKRLFSAFTDFCHWQHSYHFDISCTCTLPDPTTWVPYAPYTPLHKSDYPVLQSRTYSHQSKGLSALGLSQMIRPHTIIIITIIYHVSWNWVTALPLLSSQKVLKIKIRSSPVAELRPGPVCNFCCVAGTSICLAKLEDQYQYGTVISTEN